MFRTAVAKEPSLYQYKMVYVYLNQKMRIEQQTFKRFYVGKLLRNIIFGASFDSEHIQKNIMYKSKNKVYLYFTS